MPADPMEIVEEELTDLVRRNGLSPDSFHCKGLPDSEDAVRVLMALREAGWRIAQVDEDWTDDEDGGECWAVTTEWKPEGGGDE